VSRDEPLGHDDPAGGSAPASPTRETGPDRLVVDYEQTVGVIEQLTDVRFKLVAFVPALTGAAVALLGSLDVDALTRAALAAGGLGFTLGIVLYDLRNSQLYNSAIGRAQHLEEALEFRKFGCDHHVGVFGSRKDTDRRMEESHRLNVFSLLIGDLRLRHGPALSLVYSAVFGVWVWVLLDAGATGVEAATDDAVSEWHTWVHDYIAAVAIVVAVFAACLFYKEHARHDRRQSPSQQS
jgi:hypothetical protein